MVDGIKFRSAKEAKRYGELKALEKTGDINALELQPRFPLHAPGGTLVGHYVADFRYVAIEQTAGGGGSIVVSVVEDVKGCKTPLYRWKKKQVEAEYGIKIIEV